MFSSLLGEVGRGFPSVPPLYGRVGGVLKLLLKIFSIPLFKSPLTPPKGGEFLFFFLSPSF